MVPIWHGLFLLWLGWGTAARAQKESTQVVRATESDRVILPCMLGGVGPTPASSYLNLTWLGPLRRMLLNMEVSYRQPEASPGMDWGLLIHNISRQDGMQVTCSWEGDPGDNEVEVKDYSPDEAYADMNSEEEMENISSSGSPLFRDFAQDGTPSPCNHSEASNWTWTAVSWKPHNITKPALSVKIWRAAPYGLRVYRDTISLLLPSITSRDAGNYSCYWTNQSQHFLLEVSARSMVWPYFGKEHWIIWSVALGYVAVCLGFLFGLMRFQRFQRVFRPRRQKKKQRRSPAVRKFFHAQQDKAPASGGILLTSANEYDKEQVDVFSYENVLPNVRPGGGQQSLQKGNSLPTATKVEEDDDEEYECPDSETDQKSDNGENYENAEEGVEQGNYENAPGEVKQEDVVLNGFTKQQPVRPSTDVCSYENSKKESCGSADSWYVNSSRNGLKDAVSEDGDNYENVEEESPLSPGAERLIAGLRLHLALDSQVDKQDGGSEASTGSQSYEEMNGTLSPTPSKSLHTSNEEDVDSYENMESPNSFNSWKESSLNPQGEGAAFGSVRQNLSIPFGADL